MVGVTVMKTAGDRNKERQEVKGETATVNAERRLRMQVVSNSKGHMELNLHGRGLRQVPVQVFHMGSIHVLRLAHNHIDHLSMMISYLRSLRVLDVSHNLLVKLPETLVNCRWLTRLDVSNNRLAGLPRTLGGLRELRHLGLAGNLLEQLPQEVGQLQALRVLNLHGNRLWHLPPSLEGLRHLSRLDLGDNMLDAVPLVVTRITSLKALDLSRNRLNALPVDIDKLRGLVELNLSHNKFLAITSLLVSLTRLKYLSLAGNGLKFLPTQMDRLQNLEVIHLQGNSLKSIPALPISLKYYNVSRNRLEALTVERMRNLVSLTATHNQLSSAPLGLYKLRRLKFLYLDNNRLEELSPDLALLSELRVLTLTNNDLRQLPNRALLRLNKLASFNVKGNHKLAKKREEEEEVGGSKGLNSKEDAGGTLARDEIAGGRRPWEEDMRPKKRGGKTVVTSKGKIVFENGGEENEVVDGEKARHPNDSTHTIRSNKHSSSFHRDLPFTEKGTRFQEPGATFPRSKSKSPIPIKNSTKSKAFKDAKASKRFSSLRSLKDIFFGRTKNKNYHGISNEEGGSSGINFETRAALKPSDSLHLPINYHMDDIEYDERSNRKWNHRRMSNDIRHSGQPEYFQQSHGDSPVESFYRSQSRAKSYQNMMRDGGGCSSEDQYRNGYNTDRSLFHQGGISNANIPQFSTLPPQFHYRNQDPHGYSYAQQGKLRQAGSLRGKWPERYREFHRNHSARDFSPRNTMPFRQSHSQSWVGQEGTFYHGQNPFQAPHDSFSSGPSWRQWGRSMQPSAQPSRDHSVREAYASFATETPYSERASPESKVVYFPELDYTSASEDGGQVYPLRSYRSEPSLFNERNMPYNNNANRGSKLGSRNVYSSEDSLFNQQGREEETDVKQIYKSSSLSQNWRNASPMSRRSIEQEYPDVKRSNLLHPEESFNIPQGSSRSSLAPSRITDYVDCEDTIAPASMPRNHTATSRNSRKGHFPQFDNILSTATIQSNEADQPAYHGSPRLTPVALQHGHFLMKRKPTDQVTMTRTRSLDSILDYSPRNTSNTTGQSPELRPTAKEADRNQDQVGSQLDLRTEEAGYPNGSPRVLSRGNKHLDNTDFSLLGVCNHVETMLNKNALQEGTPFSRKRTQRNIEDIPDDEDFVSDMDKPVRASLLRYSQPQTFTLTSHGGQFVSSGRLEVLVDVPAHAVRRNLNMTMQVLSISPELLSKARKVNHFVSNIFSLGPLVYFYTDRPNVSLNSPATITLPAPPAIKGGHLMVLSVRKDNSCLPVSSGYRSGHTAATMTTWHFSGKIALTTRAKCKYKACKSLEQLLQCIGATQI